MLRFAIISIFLWLNFVHLASSTCSDLTYSKCKGFGGRYLSINFFYFFLRFHALLTYFLDAFESIDNIAERVCQDDFCKAFPNCNYWLYNRESGECYLYENEPVGSHSCNTVGGIPWENPDEICDDAQGCEVCAFYFNLGSYLLDFDAIQLKNYFNHCSYFKRVNADMMEIYLRILA